MSTQIRPLMEDDFDHWLPLWDANNLGEVNKELTAETWRRLNDSNFPIFGLCAHEEGKIIGILHYVVHPTTGNIKMIAYMQDLFIPEYHRRKGIGKALVQELATIGMKERWARIYWLTDNDDDATQAFYKNLGVKINFGLHIWPLESQ